MVLSIFIGCLPWYNFSAVLRYISQEFKLTTSDTGNIIACFQAGYVMVVIITGWLADRIGPKRVVMYATLLTAISATAFVFVVHDKWTVMFMRLLTGCACGAIYAPGMALLSNWFPPNERGGALGAYTGALVAASAGGYFVAGPIAAEAGWRAGMLWTSIPVFAAYLIILFFVQEKPVDTVKQFDGAQNAAIGGVNGYGGSLLISASYMGHMWELYTFWPWIGPFMVACATAGGMDAKDAVRLGSLLAASFTLAGAPSVWLLGKLADKLGRTRVIIICAVSSLIPEFFFGYMLGLPLPLVVIVGLWIGFWVVADSAIYKAGLTEMCPPNKRATMLGLQSAMGFFMTIISPIVFGKILQACNNVDNPTDATNWGPAFIALGVGALAAPLTALALRRHPHAELMCAGKR